MPITPPYLKKGDAIGIVCPARKITPKELVPALELLKSWGLEPVLGVSIGAVDHQFGGSDDVRRADLQMMLSHTGFKAIIAARGGYGTVRIVDGLDWRAFAKQPKWLVGYSDMTVLHSHVHQNLGIETLHATMPINFVNNTPEAMESLRCILFGEPMDYEFPHHKLNRKGQAEGQLVGGNLSLLYSLAGTPSDIDTKGKILFLEDLDEYLYHIDRMMMQLQRSGKLAGLAGLIVGGMTDMKDNTIPYGKTAEQIIKEHVKQYDYPVAFGFPAGHIDDNRALVMGREVRLMVESRRSKVEG